MLNFHSNIVRATKSQRMQNTKQSSSPGSRMIENLDL